MSDYSLHSCTWFMCHYCRREPRDRSAVVWIYQVLMMNRNPDYPLKGPRDTQRICNTFELYITRRQAKNLLVMMRRWKFLDTLEEIKPSCTSWRSRKLREHCRCGFEKSICVAFWARIKSPLMSALSVFTSAHCLALNKLLDPRIWPHFDQFGCFGDVSRMRGAFCPSGLNMHSHFFLYFSQASLDFNKIKTNVAPKLKWPTENKPK